MRQTLNAVPLANDPATRYLTWTVTFMVWLATITLGLSIIVSNLGTKWVHEPTDKFTIQINPTELDTFDTFDAKIKSAIKTLLNLPGVKSVEKISYGQMTKILRPLIGTDVLPDPTAFPLPTLIEMQLADKTQYPLERFRSSIKSAIPDAKVIQRSNGLDISNRIRTAINLLTLGIIILIFLASVASIIFTTRTGLMVHSNIIELLYLLGARNKDIARQFSNHSFIASLKGTLLGWLFAAITFLAFAQIIEWETSYVLAVLSVTWLEWTSLALIGILAVGLSMIISNITVREKLRHFG